MNLKHLKISTRLTVGFASLVALIALLGAVALYKTAAMATEFTAVMQDRYPMIVTAHEVKAVNGDVAQALRNLLVMTDPADVKAEFDLLASSVKRTDAHMAQLAKGVTEASGKQALARLTQALGDYRAARERMMAPLRESRVEDARRVLLDEVRPKQIVYMARVDELVAQQAEQMQASAHAVEATATETKLE
ncbi:MAG: MCP four helix bundle domain-containing protein, partial [Burkholderiaceae bacterium]